ncbi:hypothetical protein ACHQM5_012735 [Ranunculus cassubicifolius]
MCTRALPVVDEQIEASQQLRSGREEWLINIMMEGAEKEGTYRPRIQRAPTRLRQIEVYKKHFEPALASIGPYHHGKTEFQMMEKLKVRAANQFISACSGSIDVVYSKVVEVVAEARNSYSDGSTSEFDDEAFARVMFLDGCFLLHFIYSITNDKQCELTSCCYTVAFLLRDIFLLENQLPFVILQTLVRIRFAGDEGNKMIIEFVNQRISSPRHSSMENQRISSPGHSSMENLVGNKNQQPLHLLDLLRTTLLGVSAPPCLSANDTDWHSFRSVKELKAVGINFKRSVTHTLRAIEFKSYKIYGELSLPPITIDDSTMPRFLNLIAYEMCPDASHDYAVTSYICFLDALIDHADDVKELRSKGILLNFLGSDDQVADLFNHFTIELVPDPNIYYTVKSGIESHYKNSVKVSAVEFLTTHFKSPWTAFGFLAATFVVVLTCIQTVFTVYPK